MPDSTVILRHKAFWLFYTRVNDDPLEIDLLRHFGESGTDDHEYSEAVIVLPCGSRFSLDVTIDSEDCSPNLALRNTDTNTTYNMGWWDDARWHPYALRWPELTQLHRYWIEHLDAHIHPSAAFLLLAIFVGHGVDESDHVSERKNLIRNHYEQLQLFIDVEIMQLSDKTFDRPTEEDYNWTHDDELGWVFGGEYPCYSIRNRQHSDGSEGRFPFSDWSAVVAQLPAPESEI